MMPTVKEFRDICQKKDDENFIVDKYVFRRISIYFSYLFALVGIGPNFVTLLSFISVLLSCWGFIAASAVGLAYGVIGIVLYMLFDVCDGEVARFAIHASKKKPSPAGQYLDLLVHDFSMNLIFLSIGISGFLNYGSIPILWASVLACFFSSNFPTLTAALVVSKRLARKTNSGISAAEQALLSMVEADEESSRGVRASGLQFIIKLMKELIVYPGPKLTVVPAALLAILFPAVRGTIFDPLLVFVCGYSVLFTFTTIRKIASLYLGFSRL